MNQLGLHVLRQELTKGPNKATFIERRLIESGYLLNRLSNAFKGVAIRISKVNGTRVIGYLLGGALMALIAWFL